jgi:hypothetical protein
MRDFAEYEFVLPDGSCRYEIIDLTGFVRPQMFALKRMPDAIEVHGEDSSFPEPPLARFPIHR